MSVSEHAFIQALLARGCMKLEEAEALFKSLQKQGGSGTFADFTSSVKKSLAIADLTFTQRRIVASGGSQETWVGIVNVAADQHAKLGTALAVNQVAFFRTLLMTLASEEEYAKNGISSIEADTMDILHDPEAGAEGGTQGESSSQATGKVSLSQKLRGEALARLVQDGWLEAVGKPDRPERYRIGPRSFLELHKFLSDAAPQEVVQMWTKTGSV